MNHSLALSKHELAFCVCANFHHMATTERINKSLTVNHATLNSTTGYFHSGAGLLVSQSRHLCIANGRNSSLWKAFLSDASPPINPSLVLLVLYVSVCHWSVLVEEEVVVDMI